MYSLVFLSSFFLFLSLSLLPFYFCFYLKCSLKLQTVQVVTWRLLCAGTDLQKAAEGLLCFHRLQVWIKCMLVVRSLWAERKEVLSDSRKEWSRRGAERMWLQLNVMLAFFQNLYRRSMNVFPVHNSLVSSYPTPSLFFSLTLWGCCFRMSWFQTDNTFQADKWTPKQLHWYLSWTDVLYSEENYKMGLASFVIL